ncbi:hypothetical protein [Streptomyces aidingensis]|uniref:Uncharacterized protein n=1 Tax=Streptomyces aidingensis TaxID=910347 RepID=A0A1I1KFB1_9ACTN|nr:hypothetical protein [Streptomyces aidingensis]SFC59526.1 hypothetical protein SAMN05421773_104212 [Streptomyces aidingensis]
MNDYRVSGLAPADEETALLLEHLELFDDVFHIMAESHTSDGRQSYLLMHDSSATWGLPGAPQLVSLHLVRNPESRSFHADHARQASVHFARLWLVNRGCVPEAVEPYPGEFFEPVDAATRRMAQHIVHSGGRYQVLDHDTHDSVPEEVWVLVRDADPASGRLPVRVFLEEFHPTDYTYTLREGAFPDTDAARKWLLNRDTPLPEAAPLADAATARCQAARSRSVTASPVPPPTGAERPPAAPPASRPATRRSLP